MMHWLELESIAETQRIAERRVRQSTANAEASGETLLDLVIDSHDSGLGGRVLLTLVKRNRSIGLPWSRLRTGSPVVLTSDEQHDSSEALQGVISAKSPNSIQVSVDEWPDGDRFRLDLAADEITRRRQRVALLAASEARGRTGELRRILLGEKTASFARSSNVGNENVSATDSSGFATLNPSQQQAVRFALSAEDIGIIHGPPGTGKTTTVVQFICEAVSRGEKILACAPSNTAVDNLLERLVAKSVSTVRLGHPARVMNDLQQHTLDALVANHENMRWVKQLQREAEQLFRQAGRYTRARPAPGSRAATRQEARQLKAQARELESQAVDHVLDRADVICATTTLDDELLGPRQFDWTVIDEACQSTEPGCWIPLLRANRILLAGDHCQLPPTVVSSEAAQQGFAVSLMQRLMEQTEGRLSKRLDVQYRMHSRIMQFSSDLFYGGSLVADPSVATHRLADLPDVASTPLTDEPVTFIDTAGADYDEELEPDGESRRNPREAQLVVAKIDELLAAGVPAADIAVIAPYAAQVRLIRQLRPSEAIEVDTVDGFQGREKEAVVISLVRSNRTGEIGFLADTRRMNVALTRARRMLLVVGDSATLGGNEFYSALLSYFEQIDAYHTVWEF